MADQKVCGIPCADVVKSTKDIEAIRREMKLSFAAYEKALNVAHKELERRLENMNEIREQLTRQANTFAAKNEENLKHEMIEGRMRELERRMDTNLGATKWTDHIITVLIGFGVIIAFWLIGR